MFKVEKIACSRFDEVKAVLSGFPGNWTTADWLRLFTYQWEKDEDYCGLVLKDGDQVVGCLGMIFSRRRINNRIEKFCNLTAWIVAPKYRSRSIALLLPVLAMKDYTITDLSPSRRVSRIQKKLGFKDLDATCRLLLPFGGRLGRRASANLKITLDHAAIAGRLQGEQLRLFNDHSGYQCSHLLAEVEDKSCYLVFTRLKRKNMPYAHIHYISDLAVFARNDAAIRKAILAASRAFYILIDSRLAKGVRLPLSFSLPFRAPKLFLSATLRPDQIDNLYSEIVLMNLSTHPKPKYIVQNFICKFFRSGYLRH